jgi:hypothetical protein
MRELAVFEALIGLFLLFAIVRPYIKAFRQTSGFVFFPPLALFCCAATIPAYGPRPECIPLFLFTLIYNIINFSALTSVISRLKSYYVRNHSVIASLFVMLLLGFSLGAAFKFLPENDAKINSDKTEITLRDETRGCDLSISVYNLNGENGVIVLTPPLITAFVLIENMCVELSAKGYSVISFENVDKTSFSKKLKLFRLAVSMTDNIKLNAEQRELVFEREKDIRFILGSIKNNDALKNILINCDNIYLAGYGAGGAAAIALVGDDGFLELNPEIKAVTAIESIFLCDFTKRKPEISDEKTTFNKIIAAFKKAPPRLENVVHPKLPILFIAGDGAQAKKTKGRYIAVVQTMLEAELPFFFASVTGAHEIDFSTFSDEYPVAPIFLKSPTSGGGGGEEYGAWPRDEVIKRSAEYIADFFRLVNEGADANILKNSLETSGVFLETSRIK